MELPFENNLFSPCSCMRAVSISYNDSSIPASITTFNFVLLHLMLVANNIIILEGKTNYNYAALTFSFCRKKWKLLSFEFSLFFSSVLCGEFHIPLNSHGGQRTACRFCSGHRSFTSHGSNSGFQPW